MGFCPFFFFLNNKIININIITKEINNTRICNESTLLSNALINIVFKNGITFCFFFIPININYYLVILKPMTEFPSHKKILRWSYKIDGGKDREKGKKYE